MTMTEGWDQGRMNGSLPATGPMPDAVIPPIDLLAAMRYYRG
ncbi:MAG TPA: hypothetical protein VGK10_00070 [Prolixibacteraceae bacterium]